MNNIINAQTPIAVTSGIQEATKKGVAYVTSFAMTSNSRRKDTAWRYLKYLASRESQEFIAARGRVPPSGVTSHSRSKCVIFSWA